MLRRPKHGNQGQWAAARPADRHASPWKPLHEILAVQMIYLASRHSGPRWQSAFIVIEPRRVVARHTMFTDDCGHILEIQWRDWLSGSSASRRSFLLRVKDMGDPPCARSACQNKTSPRLAMNPTRFITLPITLSHNLLLVCIHRLGNRRFLVPELRSESDVALIAAGVRVFG